MKTRAQIYSHEASGILRDISTYGVLTQKQIFGLYPQKDEPESYKHLTLQNIHSVQNWMVPVTSTKQ